MGVVSIQTEQAIETPAHPSTSAVGVDFGVANPAVLSDGPTFRPLMEQLAKHERQLRQAQRAPARKVKFANNWQQQKARIGKRHRTIARCRHDALHKISTAISTTHAMIAIEDLNVSGMTQRAKGTVATPGTNVRAKSGLNRSILEHGWALFWHMLEYKQAWLGARNSLAAGHAVTARGGSRREVSRRSRNPHHGNGGALSSQPGILALQGEEDVNHWSLCFGAIYCRLRVDWTMPRAELSEGLGADQYQMHEFLRRI